MLTLSLLRHAKSSWDDPSLEDHERPLAPRGEKAAPRLGQYIAAAKLVPHLVLCSTAMRTRQTLALVLVELAKKPRDIQFDDALYLASPVVLARRLAAVGRSARHVMVVGHNPGLHAFALELVGSGPKDVILHLAHKFPTAALAVIRFDSSDWGEVRSGTGVLQRFTTPRELD